MSSSREQRSDIGDVNAQTMALKNSGVCRGVRLSGITGKIVEKQLNQKTTRLISRVGVH